MKNFLISFLCVISLNVSSQTKIIDTASVTIDLIETQLKIERIENKIESINTRIESVPEGEVGIHIIEGLEKLKQEKEILERREYSIKHHLKLGNENSIIFISKNEFDKYSAQNQEYILAYPSRYKIVD